MKKELDSFTVILVVAFLIFSWEQAKNKYLGLMLNTGFPSSKNPGKFRPLSDTCKRTLFKVIKIGSSLSKCKFTCLLIDCFFSSPYRSLLKLAYSQAQSQEIGEINTSD